MEISCSSVTVEAHPLVVLEALAAGLGVAVSESAAANLDRSLPFVTVIPQLKIYDRDYVAAAVQANRQLALQQRPAIRTYAETFDWTRLAPRFEEAILGIIRAENRAPVVAPARRRVAVLVIAFGRYYDEFLPDLGAVARCSFLQRRRRADLLLYGSAACAIEAVTHIQCQPLEWPFVTLLRFHLFSTIAERLKAFDIIAYVDADMEVKQDIPVDTLDHEYFAAQHPYFRRPTTATFESDGRSRASVPVSRRRPYVQACFFGGRTLPFLFLVTTLAEEVLLDMAKGQIAIWHDESYLNSFFSLRHPAKVFPFTFAYPEESRLPGIR